MGTPTQGMVQRYALLAASQERAQARGQSLPRELLNEMTAIYSQAQASLNPREQQQALATVNTLKAHAHRQLETQERQGQQAKHEFYTDKLTQEVTGYRPGQLENVLKGKPYAVKGKGMRYNKAELDASTRNMTKAFTKDGKGMSATQFDKEMENLNDLKLTRGEEAYAKKVQQKYGARAAQFHAMHTAWNEGGHAYHLEFAKRTEEVGGVDKDHYVKPSEADTRKAQIASAFAEKAMTSKQDVEAMLDDGISKDYMESEHMFGDVARAYAQHENEDNEEEMQNYTPENYSQDELEESQHADA